MRFLLLPAVVALLVHGELHAQTMRRGDQNLMSFELGPGDSAFLFLPILSVLVTTGVMILAAIALWRIMKAQESTASALQQIASSIEVRPRS